MLDRAHWPPFRFAVIQGASFAILWGGLMWFCHWQHQTYMSPVAALITSVLAGAGFGYAMLRIRHHQGHLDNADAPYTD